MQTPNTTPAPSGTPIPTDSPAETGQQFGTMLANLRPIFELDRLVSNVLDEMGLGPVTASTKVDHVPGGTDFSVLHFVILPRKAAWLDFLLETDRASALKIYEAISGVSEAADSDLADVLRETMNLIHGSLKSALKKEVVDVIIPVVPQSIPTEKLVGAPGGYSLQSRHLFLMAGASLRLTMVARIAPVTRKQLRQFRLSQVLVEPISPEGDSQLVIVKQHTMLNKRTLEKVQNMADYEPDLKTHAVIEPSPLASLVSND